MTTFDDTDLVRARGARLSRLLARTDVTAPAMAFPAERIAVAAARRSVVRWRAAAGVALLLAGAAGVPPVRAWIVQTVRSVWMKVSGSSPAGDARAPASTPASAVSMGSVTFAAPAQLLVRVEARQEQGGRITVEAGAPGTVSATITGERNAADLLVAPDGLRIANRRASTAGYIIAVPPGMRRVLVRIGQEPARSFAGPDAGERFVVDIGVRSPGADTLKQ